MPEPTMLPVESSLIESIGYDEDEEELYVRFKNGKTYVYSEVSWETFRQFQAAESAGKFFTQNIKGVFDGERR